MTSSAGPRQKSDRRVLDLTRRQREVLELIARGHTNGQIADQLGITLAGAKWHVSEIISKLGVDTREEAADYWRAYNGLPTRLFRLFRTLTPAVTVRWVLAGSAAAGVIIGAAVIVLAFQSNGDEPPRPPNLTATASPTYAPRVDGRFEILPRGSVPSTCGLSVPAGLAQQRVDVRETPDFANIGPHALALEPEVPSGWSVTEVHAETVVWTDDSTTDSLFGVEFATPDGAVRFARVVVDDDCVVRVVDDGDYELTTIGARPALAHRRRPPFLLHWFDGNVLVTIEGPTRSTLDALAASLLSR